jgi:hypothetical protein
MWSTTGQYYKCKLSNFEEICLKRKQIFERISEEKNIRMFFDVDYKCLKSDYEDITESSLECRSSSLIEMCEKAIRSTLFTIHTVDLKNNTDFIDPIFPISTANSLDYSKDSKLYWKISIHIIIVNKEKIDILY